MEKTNPVVKANKTETQQILEWWWERSGMDGTLDHCTYKQEFGQYLQRQYRAWRKLNPDDNRCSSVRIE